MSTGDDFRVGRRPSRFDVGIILLSSMVSGACYIWSGGPGPQPPPPFGRPYTDFEKVAIGFVIAAAVAGPVLLASQFWLQKRKEHIHIGEWFWLAQPMLFTGAFCLAVITPIPLRNGILAVLIFMELLLALTSTSIVCWWIFRPGRGGQSWSNWAGLLICAVVAAYFLFDLSRHPVVI